MVRSIARELNSKSSKAWGMTGIQGKYRHVSGKTWHVGFLKRLQYEGGLRLSLKGSQAPRSSKRPVKDFDPAAASRGGC